MTAFRLFVAAIASLALAFPGLAQDHPEALHIHDAYARSSGGIDSSGAVFLVMHNNTGTDDRLLGARTDVAERAELHTHSEDANGVMSMGKIEGGIALPAGEMHELARGGDHLMLLGLTRDLKDGDVFTLTLIFEAAGEVTIEVPVNNARKPGQPMDMDHSGHAMTAPTE